MKWLGGALLALGLAGAAPSVLAQSAQDMMRDQCLHYWQSIGEKNQTVMQSRCLCLDKLVERELTPAERTLYANENALRTASDRDREALMRKTANLREAAQRECRFPTDR